MVYGMAIGHSPESEKYFSEAEICREILEIPHKERLLPNFRLRNLKFQSPKTCNSIPPPPFHTPTRLPPRNVWVSIKLLSAKFGFPPPKQRTPNEGKLCKISRKSSKLTLFQGGGGTQFIVKTILRTSGRF